MSLYSSFAQHLLFFSFALSLYRYLSLESGLFDEPFLCTSALSAIKVYSSFAMRSMSWSVKDFRKWPPYTFYFLHSFPSSRWHCNWMFHALYARFLCFLFSNICSHFANSLLVSYLFAPTKWIVVSSLARVVRLSLYCSLFCTMVFGSLSPSLSHSLALGARVSCVLLRIDVFCYSFAVCIAISADVCVCRLLDSTW